MFAPTRTLRRWWCASNYVRSTRFANDINDAIISSLFGDGCAAVVVGASPVKHPLAPGKVVIRRSFSRLLDDAEDGIVLGVNHNGITCELSENLPGYIYDGVDPVVTRRWLTTDYESPTSTCGRSIRADQKSSRNRCGLWHSRRRSGGELGGAGPVRQHAQRIADLCAGSDGGQRTIDQGYLHWSGVLVCAGRGGRGNDVRHHPALIATNDEGAKRCNSSNS